MKTVWKFELLPHVETLEESVMMPSGSLVRHVGSVGEGLLERPF